MGILKAIVSAQRTITIGVNGLNDWIGKVVAFFVIPMTLILFYEVVMRYVFDNPTFWAHEISQMFYGAHLLLGGAYCLRWKSHVNIDFLQIRLSVRRRAMVDLFTWLFFFLFASVLLWKGAGAAIKSVDIMRHTQSAWGPPIWPLDLVIPIGAGLLLLQGIIKYWGDIYTVITGRELIEEVVEKEAI